MKKTNIFVGIVIIFVGALILLSMFHVGVNIRLLPVLLTLLLFTIGLKGFASRNFIPGMLSTGGILYLWQNQLRLPDLYLIPLLLAALLLGIGLQLIIGKGKHWSRKSKSFCGNDALFSSATNTDSGEYVHIETNFGDQSRFVNSPDLKKVEIECNFSGVKVYFDQCRPNPEGMSIHVACNFSSITLFVPKTWKIISSCECFAGSLDQSSAYDGENKDTRITLTGEINFGNVKLVCI